MVARALLTLSVVAGAAQVHYLLEKARLAGQGSGERNYHIFYFVCRGGKADGHSEVADFKLEDIDANDKAYAKLVEGGSTLIGHGHGPE